MQDNRFVAIGAKQPERQRWLAGWCQTDDFPKHIALVYLTEPQFSTNNFPWEQDTNKPSRVVVLWDQLPIRTALLVRYKNKFGTDQDHSIVFCPPDCPTLDDFQNWVVALFRHWTPVQDEADSNNALTCGQYVEISENPKPGELSNTFVSMSFGPMRELVEQLEHWKQHYYQQIACITSAVRDEFHKHLRSLLKQTDARDSHTAAADLKKSLDSINKLCDTHKIFDIHPADRKSVV